MSETISLVRGGHVLTMGVRGDIAGGAVAVSGERIADVGTYAELSRKYPGAKVVGDDYGIVIPGLVNAHTHMSEALIPGMAENLTIWVWATRLLMPIMPHLTREMARIGTLFRGAELIRSGRHHRERHVLPRQSVRLCKPRRRSTAWRNSACAASYRSEPKTSPGARTAPLPVTRILEEHHALAERCAASRARRLPRGSWDDPGPERCAARSFQ